jgi:uncharacterized protein (TIGR03435 family)
MTRRLLLATATVLAAAPTSSVRSATDARPAFQGVSVKPSTLAPSERGTTRLQPGGGFAATNVTLRQLIEFAHQRHPFDRREVTGGPAWVDTDRFDVVARAASEHVIDPDGGLRHTWDMVQTLLAQRFKLRVHEENKDRPVYALMRAQAAGPLGPRLRRTDADCSAATKGPPTPPRAGQGPPCGVKTPPGRLFANTATMATIASLLSPHLDRAVVDRTALEGRFDVELEAAEIKAPPDYKPGPSDLGLPPAAGPSIFVAVRQQLGLRLEPQVAPVPIVVIDYAEKPAPD